jgi:hypothetical protein
MLAEFVDEVWAPRARRRLAPKTWARDSIVYEKHVRPALGELPIAAIDVEALVEWQDRLEDAGVGAPTLVKAMSIASSIFREAVRRPRTTGVSGNPVALLQKPRTRRRRRPLVWGPLLLSGCASSFSPARGALVGARSWPQCATRSLSA